jgi:hypothetical protein
MRSQQFERVEALNLLEIIMEYYPDFQDTFLKKEAVFTRLYPGKPFVERKIDKIMVHLTKCLRSFQLHHHYMQPENEFNQLLDILQVYKTKGLMARYQQAFRQLESFVGANTKKSLKTARQQFLFENEKMDFNSLFNTQKNDLNLPNTIKEFEYYHDLQRIDLVNRYLLQKKLTNLNPPQFLFDIINFELQKDLKNESSILFVYQYIAKILYKSDVSVFDFNKILKIIQESEDVFDYETLFTLNAYLRNLCVLLINQGYKEFQKTLFDIQNSGIRAGYQFYKGKITPSAYVGALKIALEVKEIDWAINFIETNKEIIIGETPDKIYYRFCYANYLFSTRQFAKVIDFLPLSITELSFTLMARRLEIKTYYELKSDLVHFKLETFKMFVVRLPQKNLPPDTIAFNANFTRIVSQLLNSSPGDYDRGVKLIQRIAEKRYISDREWLYEKASEIGRVREVEVNNIIKNTPILED